MIEKIALFGVFLLSFSVISAQENSEIAASLKQLDTASTVKSKVAIYADLSWEYTLMESDSALYYAEEGIKISREEKYPLGEAISLSSKGLYFEMIENDFQQASQSYFDGIAICETNDLPYIESLYHNLGIMFHQTMTALVMPANLLPPLTQVIVEAV